MRIVIRNLFFLSVVALLAACVSTPADVPQGANEKAAEINVQLGIKYFGKGEFKLADEKLRRALKQDPRSATAHWVFALLQERLGEDAEAEKLANTKSSIQ